MDAHLLGFACTLGKNISIDDFFDHLHSLRDKEIRFGMRDRMIYVGEKDEFYVGIFLTLKEQKKLAEMNCTGDNQYTVTVRELEAGTSVVDFNFFVLHKTTLKGVYQHYYQSCSLNQFGEFLSRQYSDFKKERIAEETSAASRVHKSISTRQLNNKYKGKFKLDVIVRQDKLPQLLDELNSITIFEFDAQSLSVMEDLFGPTTKNYVKRETHRIRFSPRTSVTFVKMQLLNVVEKLKLTKARFEGKNDDNETKVFRLLEKSYCQLLCFGSLIKRRIPAGFRP